MEHFFELPVRYKGATLILRGRLVTFAYSYKFYVMVNGRELIFERDDEQQFRVLQEASEDASEIDRELIQQIIITLNDLQQV
ncbi:hypothetical protein [Niabella drilacis]|nr:hypothetical protein [Niabella drilacis]